MLALVIWPFTTHLLRDGVPMLLLTRTPASMLGAPPYVFFFVCHMMILFFFAFLCFYSYVVPFSLVCFFCLLWPPSICCYSRIAIVPPLIASDPNAGGGVVLIIVGGANRMTVFPRISTTPEQHTTGFPRPGADIASTKR